VRILSAIIGQGSNITALAELVGVTESAVSHHMRGLRQNLRALRPGRRLVVFDKFVPDAGRLTPGRRLLNLGSILISTDINRQFGDLSKRAGMRLIRNEPCLLKRAYRVILLQRATG